MKNYSMRFMLFMVIAASFLSTHFVYGQEEAFDLEAEVPVVTPAEHKSKSSHSLAQLKIMGRVDLVFENNPDASSELKNNHFLLFLKVKASPKVGFMGEFVQQSFYYVDYAASSTLTAQFGKILVPFGDDRYFHRYYGGLQGYGAQGVMLPNIWAEPGVNLIWNLGDWRFDTYIVNSFAAANESSDVDFQTSTPERQALGARSQYKILPQLNLILSLYATEYWSNRELYMGGLDLSSDYGVFGLRNFRFALGMAHAQVEDSPTTGGSFQKSGDYLQVSTNYFSGQDWRIRYGTYEDDDRDQSVEDSHSLNFGVSFSVDVLKVLVEHQLNYEAVNEVNNDLTRAMVSVDF